MHGYFSDYALDYAEDLVIVPSHLTHLGVLLEPLIVVEKACALALRLRETTPRTALIAGAGPIGILAGLVLAARGLAVSMTSLEPADHPRARLARRAGFDYGGTDRADIVIEATGSEAGVSRAIGAIDAGGAAVLLGAADPLVPFPATRMILENLVIAGSVNSSPQSWADAVRDLELLPRDILEALITRHRFSDFRETIASPPADEVKTVHVIGE